MNSVSVWLLKLSAVPGIHMLLVGAARALVPRQDCRLLTGVQHCLRNAAGNIQHSSAADDVPHGTSVQFFNGMAHFLTSERRLDVEFTQARRLKVQVHHYLKPAHIYRAGTSTVPPLFPPIAKPQG